MGMMARMRGLASWFIITVGGLFVLFMVISDSKVTDIRSQHTMEIGSINGVPVTQQEFSDMVDNFIKNQEAQTGQKVPEEQMEDFRDYVWDALVSQRLIDEKIKEFGITVSNEEIEEIVLGENPPEFLKQGFIDSAGNFNRQAYFQAIKDPQNKEILIQLENQIRQQLIQQKLMSYLGASVLVSDDEVRRQFIDQTVRMNVEFAAVDAKSFSDKDITVTDADIQSYFDEHKEDYKTDERRAFKYVFFSTTPTKSDSNTVKNQLLSVLGKLKADTISFKSYVDIYSVKPYSLDTLDVTKMSNAMYQELSKSAPGEIVGPVLTNEGYGLFKLNSITSSKDNFVRASHILIQRTANDEADKAKADSVYQSLIGGADFAAAARKISADPGSGSRGGDLGWFGKGMMVKEFEEACFSGQTGVIQKPVKTNFGYHIIKVADKSSSRFVVEEILMKIDASGATLSKASEDADGFSYLSKQDGFDLIAKNYNYVIKTAPLIDEKTTVIPALGRSKALIKFLFDGSAGDISDRFKVTGGYTVIEITEIQPEGYVKIDEAKESIRSKVLLEKKLEKGLKILNEVYPKVAKEGKLSNASSYNKIVKFNSAENISANGAVAGIGRDYAFNGYALNGKVNEISKPIKGTNGCYLIKVTQRTAFDSSSFTVRKAQMKQQISQNKKRMIQQQWIEKLKEEAEIIDERYKYYQ